ncbi:MAG: triose-phosphate isomerase [Dehalococcoidia bacterium]
MASPLVAGNWKMNTAVREASELANALKDPLSSVNGLTSVVCPPFVSLAAVRNALEGSPVAVGAQNMHPEPKGAFTGEVSGTMLADLCSHVILGHSERRQLFAEDDAFINRKVLAALGLGLTPILCVGETLDEREAGDANAVVVRQLGQGLAGVGSEDIPKVVVAYEPVWAIGTGRAATPEIAQEMMAEIRRHVAELSSEDTAQQVPLLYGGSVNAGNADVLAGQPDIDGALVGGASLQVPEFVAIAQAFAKRAA